MSAQSFSGVDRHAEVLPAFNRDAAALARAKRARVAFQARLVERFSNFLRGSGREPSDSDLRMFALLAAAEHQLERRLLGMPFNRSAGLPHEASVLPASRAQQ